MKDKTMSKKNSRLEKNKLMLRVIRRAIALLKNRGWTKGEEAIDKFGTRCEVTDQRACKFCAIGAINRAIIDINGVNDFLLFNDIEELLNEDVRQHTKYKPSTFVDKLGRQIAPSELPVRWVQLGYKFVAHVGIDKIVDYNDFFAKDKRYIIRAFERSIKSLIASK